MSATTRAFGGTPRTLGRRAGRRLAVCLGIAAAFGWCWALALAFVPAHAADSGGTDVACGSPVFFDHRGFAASHDASDNPYDDPSWLCASSTSKAIGHAVGIGLFTTPVMGIALWAATTLRGVAEGAEPSEESESPVETRSGPRR